MDRISCSGYASAGLPGPAQAHAVFGIERVVGGLVGGPRRERAADGFLADYRIRVDISSSDFPQYDRNTNTGGQINAESIGAAVIATNTIHTGPVHPGRIVLPIIQR